MKTLLLVLTALLIPLSLFASDPTEPTATKCPRIKERPPLGPMPAPTSNSLHNTAIPEADRLDDWIWRRSAEATNVWNEIAIGIIKVGAERATATGKSVPRTSNEAAVLVRHMQSPHYYARYWAVIASMSASTEPGRSMVLPYVTGLLTDRVYRVRRNAADTLGWIGDTSSIPYLEPLLMDRGDVSNAAREAILMLQKKELEEQSETNKAQPAASPRTRCPERPNEP